MYLDNLRETEQVLMKYQMIQTSSKSEDALSSNLAVISGTVQEISRQLDLCREARKELVPDAGPDRETVELLYSQLSQISSDLESGTDVTAGKESLNKQFRAFRDAENNKWKKAVENKAKGQVALLQQLGAFTTDKYATASIVSILKANLVQMPKDVPSVEKYAKVLKNAEEIVKDTGGTPVIMNFVNKVTSGQAFLSDLNNEVMKWITDHGMQDRIRITIE